MFHSLSKVASWRDGVGYKPLAIPKMGDQLDRANAKSEGTNEVHDKGY